MFHLLGTPVIRVTCPAGVSLWVLHSLSVLRGSQTSKCLCLPSAPTAPTPTSPVKYRRLRVRPFYLLKASTTVLLPFQE